MTRVTRPRRAALLAPCFLLLACAAPANRSDVANTSVNLNAAPAATPSTSPPAITASRPSFARGDGESLQSFGARVIPEGMRLEHPVTEVEFGGAGKSVVVLFNEEEYRPFVGWVFVPEGEGYKRLELPEAQFPVGTEVKAVFPANADRDPEPELLIICEQISGVGKPPGNITPYCNAYVYDLTGDNIAHLRGVGIDLEPEETNCTAVQIRRRLKRLGY